MAKNNSVFTMIGGALIGFASAFCAFNAVTKKEQATRKSAVPGTDKPAPPTERIPTPVEPPVKEEVIKPADISAPVKNKRVNDVLGEPTSIRHEDDLDLDIEEFVFFDDEEKAMNGRYDHVWEDATDEEREVYVMRKGSGKSSKEVFETPITADEVSESISVLKDREESNEKETFSTLDRLKETYGK